MDFGTTGGNAVITKEKEKPYMRDYVIFTDSACDLDRETLESWGVRYVSLTFSFEGDPTQYGDLDMPRPEFYARMRAGGVAKTSAVNIAAFTEEFGKTLDEGRDILYVGFSSGLSNTVNAGEKAAEDL